MEQLCQRNIIYLMGRFEKQKSNVITTEDTKITEKNFYVVFK